MRRNIPITEGRFVGDQKRGHEIGFHGSDVHVWVPCEKCQRLHWVRLVNDFPRSKLCQSCSLKGRRNWWNDKAGEKNHNWKGGRGYMHSQGYWHSWIPKDSFFHPMRDTNGYVAEHRLVMAQHLGRCLQSWEIVHHRNRHRLDNRIENLQLVSEGQHKQITIMESRIRNLETRVTLLEAENALLRAENGIAF